MATKKTMEQPRRNAMLSFMVSLALVQHADAFTVIRPCSLPDSSTIGISDSTTRRHAVTVPSASTIVGPRMPIDETYPGLEPLYSNPDIFVVRNFLDDASCQDLMQQARPQMQPSPVAYAGWTQDVKDLVELAAKGPVAWLALGGAWWQLQSSGGTQVDLVIHAIQNYAVLFVVCTALIAGFTYWRAQGLQALRTSTSTTLDDLHTSPGAKQFVENAARLFGAEGNLRQEAALFEAPTCIRYEADQLLAPHFDANRSADTEDANRGGQTLATLIVYLNDVTHGGRTRFGQLLDAQGDTLTIPPKQGDALLFFPADANGQFDERLEHEGCPARDEKWIARIWRHAQRVPPPFGLDERALGTLDRT